MAELDFTNIAASSIATPAAGVTAEYVDSTTKKLASKNDAGLVSDYADLASAQSITGVKTLTNPTTAAGTLTVPSYTQTSGTNMTTPTAGVHEFDGVGFYSTIDTTHGRGQIPVRQHFRLTSNGSNVTTIANFFGANSNISLLANAYYEIEIVCYFTKTTTEILTWTFTNNVAPTMQNIYWEQSPITGIVAPPGTATMTEGMFANDATAIRTVAAGSLTTAVNHYMRCRITLKNATGTSLKIQCANPAGSVTPLLGSFWTATRIPTGNTGTFAA